MLVYYSWRWLLIVGLGLLVYGQTFHYGFVFDDYLFIVNNAFIKNFDNIHLIWKQFPMTRFLGMYSFAFNYHLGQLNPSGYHLFNFLVHLTATGLVWALGSLLFKITQAKAKTQKNDLAFIISLIFLVHPGQTQAVTYITQRYESMATVFYLTTVYFYLRARVSKENFQRLTLFGLAGVTTVLGALTKEVVITLPLMVLAAEWILFPRTNHKKVLFILAGVGILLYLFFTQLTHTGWSAIFSTVMRSESHDGDSLTALTYMLTEMRVFLTFLRLLFLPVHQNIDYDYPASTGLFHPPLTFVGLLVIGGVIFSIIRLRRTYPLIAFGLSWMLITFAVNLVPRFNVIFEHKLYLISFGFFLAVVAALSVWIQDRSVLVRILACIIVVLGFLSFERNKVWANELLLWQDCVSQSPDKERTNANLGRIYGSMGQYDQSVYYLSRAISLRPDNITYENRGVIYAQLGKPALALEDLNHSIGMDPTYFPTYVKRAWVYQTLHQYQDALADLNHALAMNSYYTDAYIERGILWMQMGQKQNAINDFQQVLKIDPLNAEASQYLSSILGKTNP
jgi:Tfp pilus assembly protein PilF